MVTPEGFAEATERLRQAFGSTADLPGAGDTLFVPERGVTYATGSVARVLDSREFATATGLIVPGTVRRADDRYMGTYITARDYIFDNDVQDLADVLRVFADQAHRADLITALATVNQLIGRDGGGEQLWLMYRAALQPIAQRRLDAARRQETGGLGRVLAARHPILLAIRWLLGTSPSATPSDPAAGATPAHAIAFSHLIAASSFDTRVSEGEAFDEEHEKLLMLSMMNLGTLGDVPDIYASIDQTLRLWRDYGHLAKDKIGESATEALKHCTGLHIEDLLACAFGCIAHVRAWEPGQPFVLSRSLSETTPPQLAERFLELVGMPLDEAVASFGRPVSEFDLVALESRPILLVPSGAVILDDLLLWRRCTTGLYWFVHDAIKAARGETARLRWTQAFAAMIESYAEDALRATAPRTFESNGSTFYTEESLEMAYGQVARCDVAIDFGDCFLLLEIVSGQLTVKARVHNDMSNFDRDLEKLVFGKCEQIHNAARCILQDEEPLTGVKRGVRNVRIIPALVIGGGLPLNFVTYNYIRRVLEGADLLQDSRIGPLAILDLDNVDQLEGMSEKGFSPPSLLEAWQRSDHDGLPLHNYLFASYPGAQRRPARMKASVEVAMADIRRRHGMP